MLKIGDDIEIPASEIELNPIRSSGPGGQHVNKVSTAIHLRFDARASAALPDAVRERLLATRDQRISADGVINIKSSASRSREANKAEALSRLADLVASALEAPRPRKKTRPPPGAREKRLSDKAHRSKLKAARGKIPE